MVSSIVADDRDEARRLLGMRGENDHVSKFSLKRRPYMKQKNIMLENVSHITIFLIPLTFWHQTHHILGKLFRNRHESRRRNRCAVFPNPQLIKIILNMTNCIDDFLPCNFFKQVYYLKWDWNNDTSVEIANTVVESEKTKTGNQTQLVHSFWLLGFHRKV